MGGIHTEAPAPSNGPAPLRCQECGKVLESTPFTVTINLVNPQMEFQGTIEVPVCDEECGRRFMFRVKDTMMMRNPRVGEGS